MIDLSHNAATEASTTCPDPPFTSSVEQGKAVCPGDELTFNCSLLDGVGLIWIGSTFNCPEESNFILITGSIKASECGPFNAQKSTGSSSDCYTSTLSVTASHELNGTVVQCLDHLTDQQLGSTTFLVQGEN